MAHQLKQIAGKILRRPSRVRTLEERGGLDDPQRRRFISAFAASGATLPAAYLFYDSFSQRSLPPPRATEDGQHSGTVRIVRDFADPNLELLRLLREAAEIEHALLIQYLYAAFSVKPQYADLVGYGDPNTNDLIGVAIQEMVHLSLVNQLLVALGAPPVLARQDLPYEPDIYPFQFMLEPLSRESVAKYVYTEAPAAALDRAKLDARLVSATQDRHFIDELELTLGGKVRPNHVGSLYDKVIATFKECCAAGDTVEDPQAWLDKLNHIKEEGEDGHFHFFKSVFMGTHKAFRGDHTVWRRPPGDPRYPSLALPSNVSAYVGHEQQIKDPVALGIAWLGNLHYWLFLMLLEHGYREHSQVHRDAAKMLMMGPFWSISRHLPTLGVGMPFDQLSMGYCAGIDRWHAYRQLSALAREIGALEARLAGDLPADYPSGTARDAIDMIGSSVATAAVAAP